MHGTGHHNGVVLTRCRSTVARTNVAVAAVDVHNWSRMPRFICISSLRRFDAFDAAKQYLSLGRSITRQKRYQSWVGSRFCSFRWVGLGWVEYGKSTIFLMITQYTIALLGIGITSTTALYKSFTYLLTVYFMVTKIVSMCSNMTDINCRQFCC